MERDFMKENQFVHFISPWFRRGEGLTGGKDTGMFAVSQYSGSLFVHAGFRVIYYD